MLRRFANLFQYIREAIPVFVVTLTMAFLWCVFIEMPFAKLEVTLVGLLMQKRLQGMSTLKQKDKHLDNKEEHNLESQQHFEPQKICCKTVDVNNREENNYRF